MTDKEGTLRVTIQKIPRTDKLSVEAAKEELIRVNEQIAELSTDEFLWDKKRRLLAIIRNSE